MLLNKHNLNIWKFCHKEDSRYVLRALLVTQDETVATDGHILIRVTTPKLNESLFPEVEGFAGADLDGPVLLPADAAKEIADSIPKGEKNIPVLGTAKLAKGKNGLKAVATDLDLQHVIERTKIDGEFPKWRAVMPDKKPVAEVVLNADLVKSLFQYFAAFSDSGAVRIQVFGPDQGVRFDAEDFLNGQGATAVLMPLRSSSDWEYAYRNGKKK